MSGMSAMPGEKTLGYGAAASLALVALIYVFSPSFIWENSSHSSSERRKGVVGLVNTANDCFINSVLQALAGLPELRVYLIHRTKKAIELGELEGTDARRTFLSGALKEILDNLNERPIHRKTISARPFLSVLESVFQRQLSRTQQDAQEFLQVVAEKIADEYRAMKDLERGRGSNGASHGALEAPKFGNGEGSNYTGDGEGEGEGFPFEGDLESEIECTNCHHKPKPSLSTFVVLTLPVPQKSSTTLNDCIDSVLSKEYIDDYQCEKCKLQNAVDVYKRKLAGSTTVGNRETYAQYVQRLEEALDKDPEKPPDEIPLPPARTRIIKRTRISNYPNVLALHLSRSIFDYRSARRNSCKVSFPEKLILGGMLDQQRYKLHCVVIHKGAHDSGHYECFRRQIVFPPPFSTPSPLPQTPIMSPTPTVAVTSETTSLLNGSNPAYGAVEGQIVEQGTATPSRVASPTTREGKKSLSSSPIHETDAETQYDTSSTYLSLDRKTKSYRDESIPNSSSISSSPQTTYVSDDLTSIPTLTVPSRSSSQAPSRSPSPSRTPSPSITPTATAISNTKTHKYKLPDNTSPSPHVRKKAKRKVPKLDNRWWRISDDKIKEAKTDDVLDQQREVYLLFYQRVEKEKDEKKMASAKL